MADTLGKNISRCLLADIHWLTCPNIQVSLTTKKPNRSQYSSLANYQGTSVSRVFFVVVAKTSTTWINASSRARKCHRLFIIIINKLPHSWPPIYERAQDLYSNAEARKRRGAQLLTAIPQLLDKRLSITSYQSTLPIVFFNNFRVFIKE